MRETVSSIMSKSLQAYFSDYLYINSRKDDTFLLYDIKGPFYEDYNLLFLDILSLF